MHGVALRPQHEAIRGVALCAGIGGLELALGLVFPDCRTVVYVEREAFAAATLVARMADGALDPAPVWDDVATFDGRRWRGRVDLVSAGFPCQPWSAAGYGDGFDDERWIWPDLRDRIREMDPALVWLENVPPLVSRGGLAAVLADLAELGFDAEWGCVSAADVGASHRRERLFVLAYHHGVRLPQFGAPHDNDGRDASGHDADRRSAPMANTGCAERWRSTQSADVDRARASGDDRGAGGPLSDASATRLQRREQRDASQGGDGPQSSRPVAELRGASVEHAARDGRGSAPTGWSAQSGSEHAGRDIVGDAARGGQRAVRESSGGERFVDGADAVMADAADGFISLEERRAARRAGTRSTDAALADADGGTIRQQSERDQWEGRRVRAAEREHAESRAAVPLFPPAPSDLDAWRDVLAICPELAPAIGGDVVVHAPRRVQCAEHQERDDVRGRWPDEQAGTGAAGRGVIDDERESQTESPVRRVVDGASARVDQLRACGNAVVPLAAAYAFCALAARAGKIGRA